MSSCPSCGHEPGAGRFCVSCGAPVDPAPVDEATPPGAPAGGTDTFATSAATLGDWRTDTAERKVPRRPRDPRTPPAAVAPPPPPRYPLYADEVEGYTPYGPLTGAEVLTPPVELEEVEPLPHPRDRRAGDGTPIQGITLLPGYGQDDDERRSPVLWILAVAVVLVLLGAGWWFLVRDHGSAQGAPGSRRAAQESAPGLGEAVELAGRATAKAPDTAPPNDDVDGRPVSYDASNMLDGVPDTAWRVAGDATGTELTFTLPRPAELRRVGMINGYAKTSTDERGRTFDWYLGNRRVKAAVWVFDDGRKVRQQLAEDRKLQVVDVAPVTTRRVVLRLVVVSAPGSGTAARDFTAISEVSLLGVPEA